MHAAGAWERVPGYPGERESLTAAGYMCIPACARRLSGVHKYIYLLTEHSSTSHRIACHHLSHPGLIFLLTAVTYIYTCPRVCVCVHSPTSSHLGGTPSSRPSAYTAHRTAPPLPVRCALDATGYTKSCREGCALRVHTAWLLTGVARLTFCVPCAAASTASSPPYLTTSVISRHPRNAYTEYTSSELGSEPGSAIGHARR